MHIVFHTSEYPGKDRLHGGVGTVVRFLVRRYSEKGHRVTVVGINNKPVDEIEIDGDVKIYRLALSKWKTGKFWDHSRRILKTLDKIHRENPIDIVEGAELAFAFYPGKTPFKKVIRLHGGHHFFSIELGQKPRPWRSFQEKQSFRKADAYIAVSDYVGRQTRKYLHYDFPYEVIYNTLDLHRFEPANEKDIMPGRLLFVGTLVEKKGIRQLLEAMPYIIERFPGVRLDVVGRDGRHSNGSSYAEFLKNEVITDAVRPYVRFHGGVPHDKVMEFIRGAEVCVYPSQMEAMPMAWIEVLAMGKPFIGGDIGPGKEIIIPKKTGLLADPYNPRDIAEKALWMLRNKEKARQMGLAARRHVLQLLDPEKIVNQNIVFYEKLLSK